MNEHKLLQGAAIAEEIAKSFDDEAVAPGDWELIYCGLLASFAAALVKRIGTERACEVLDRVKASLPQDGGSPSAWRH